MVFSSLLFLFYFLPIVLGLYYLALRVSGRHGAHLLLTAVSYVFYGWANPAFILLMFVSTLIDYTCGLFLTGQFEKGAWSRPVPVLPRGGERTRTQKIALICSVVSNLSLLGFFKYFNFGIDSWNAVMQAIGLHAAVYQDVMRVTLPLGISFYTF